MQIIIFFLASFVTYQGLAAAVNYGILCHVVLGTVATGGANPVDVLRRGLDVTRLAVNAAVIRVSKEDSGQLKIGRTSGN